MKPVSSAMLMTNQNSGVRGLSSPPSKTRPNDLADRTGLAVSAVRFYETHGIVRPLRNSGGHRRYGRSDIRRLSFAMIARSLGFSLSEIGTHLARLADHEAPDRAAWAMMARGFARHIDDRIASLTDLRDKLDGCIGCCCLSLD